MDHTRTRFTTPRHLRLPGRKPIFGKTFHAALAVLMLLSMVVCSGCAGHNGGGSTPNNYPEIPVRYVNNSTHEDMYMDAGTTIVPETANLVPQGEERTETVQFIFSGEEWQTFTFVVKSGEGEPVTGMISMTRSEANSAERIVVTWNGSTVEVTRIPG